MLFGYGAVGIAADSTGGAVIWTVVRNVTNQPERWVRLMESADPPTSRRFSIEVVERPSPYMTQVVITAEELHAIALAAGFDPAPWADLLTTRNAEPQTRPEGT